MQILPNPELTALDATREIDLQYFCSKHDSLFVAVEIGLIVCPTQIQITETEEDSWTSKRSLNIGSGARMEPVFYFFTMVPTSLHFTKTTVNSALESYGNHIFFRMLLDFKLLVILADLSAFIGTLLIFLVGWGITAIWFSVIVWIISLVVHSLIGKAIHSFGNTFQICLHTLTISAIASLFLNNNLGLWISFLWTLYVMYKSVHRPHAE